MLGEIFDGLFRRVVVIFIWIEAVGRLHNPPTVHGLTVMAIALVGIAVNSFSAWMTSGDTDEGKAGMAVRAIFVHVVSDLVGSFGVLTAGGLSYFTGWHEAPPAPNKQASDARAHRPGRGARREHSSRAPR